LLTSSPVKQTFQNLSYEQQEDLRTIPYIHEELNKTKDSWDEEGRDVAASLPPIKPNRKKGGRDIEMAGVGNLTETNLSVHNLRFSNINPMISNFTSPIGEFHCFVVYLDSLC
jgi:hypothetical protein